MNSILLVNYLAKLPRSVHVSFLRAIQTLRPLHSQDHYKTLNLNKSCSDKEVRDAYIKLSKEFHPDRNPNGHKQGSRFVEINEAYSVLGKAESRKRYDLSMTQTEQSAWNNEPFDDQSATRNPYADHNQYNYQDYYNYNYNYKRSAEWQKAHNSQSKPIPLDRLVLSVIILMFIVGIIEFRIVKSVVPKPKSIINGIPVFTGHSSGIDESEIGLQQLEEFNSGHREFIERAVEMMRSEDRVRQREQQMIRSMVENRANQRKEMTNTTEN